MECQQEGDEKEDNISGNAFVKRQSSPLCHFNLKFSHLALLCMDILYPVQLCPPQHYHSVVLDCPVTAYHMLSKELGSSTPPSCQIQVMGFPLTHIRCSRFPHLLSSVFLPMDIPRWESCHQECIPQRHRQEVLVINRLSDRMYVRTGYCISLKILSSRARTLIIDSEIDK